MLERLLIAGSGGQGVLLIARLVASVAVKSIQHVTFFPSYGAEVRGGASSCHVILSSHEIASPLADHFDTMIIMSKESADKFLPHKGKDCLAVINSSLCCVPVGKSIVAIKATGMANELGDTCVANFIMLGAYLARKPVVLPADIEHGARSALAGRNRLLVDLNIRAFRMGLTR
jgi:2-oxoglutarate ferredoxin oxidoreductase subunit gamma